MQWFTSLRTETVEKVAAASRGRRRAAVVDPAARAGALHVGPRSAGAVPGPVCYDQGGTEVTLTDANVHARLPAPRAPAERAPRSTRARRARALAEQIAAPLGIDVADAAHGVYLLGCAGMARAVRAVTIERGRDPRDFTLVAFGGNGPLFAAEMARSLEIGTRPGPARARRVQRARPARGRGGAPSASGPSSARSSAPSRPRSRPWWRSWSARPETLLRAEGSRARWSIGAVDRPEVPGAVVRADGAAAARVDRRGAPDAGAALRPRARAHLRPPGGGRSRSSIVNLRLTARVLRPADRAAIRLQEDRAGRGGERRAYFGPASRGDRHARSSPARDLERARRGRGRCSSTSTTRPRWSRRAAPLASTRTATSSYDWRPR